MFRLSCAQIQFLAIDNTHTKYLHGAEKKAWNNYADALKAQRNFDKFVNGLNIPQLAEGEEYEIPLRKGKKQ